MSRTEKVYGARKAYALAIAALRRYNRQTEAHRRMRSHIFRLMNRARAVMRKAGRIHAYA